MKKQVLIPFVCSLTLLCSCSMSMIKPSSHIVEKEYRQSAFDKIDISTMGNVKFVQGKENDYRVVLTAPENYHDLYKFEVDKGELEVNFKQRSVNIETKDVKILIYAPTLCELENSGLSTVETDSLCATALKVENSGVGVLRLKGLRLSMIDVECSGVGSIDLGGETGRAKLECSGVGGINAENLKARAVIGEVSGVGGINCFASDSLKATVSGVGSLKYGGDPQHKIVHSSGVGKILPIE